MRALLVISVYLTAMLLGAGGAASVSVEIAKRQARDGENSESVIEPGSEAFVAEQLSLLTWGMMMGALCFVALHTVGYVVWRKRLEEEDKPLLGLWIPFGAAVLAMVFGGILGATVAG